MLEVVGATHHNLKKVDARIPLGVFTCVTGVSGSGKSSLVNDILFKELDRRLHRAQTKAGAHERIDGVDQLDKVIRIDQKPIGRTPRSNPATYTDVLTPIRQLLAQMPEAKVRGYKQGRFSFNVKGGRCEACEGNGANLVEMEFLADVWVTCEQCEGRRFNRETLTIRYKDKSIADILAMEVEEALGFFANQPQIRRVLQTLNDVGLGYIKLGQPAPTLSGGEAQRVKLAKELCRRSTGKTLYLLDEPTTGLHFADVDKLLKILHTFADQGNTVVVIEHNMDVIKTADYLLDMGPEGGGAGGRVVAGGPPEEVAKIKASHTGRILKGLLRRRPAANGAPPPAPAAPDAGLIRHIDVVGARMHNLRGIDVRIPRDAMTVVSGVSGSGKSSLAFDTLYAEGQRRYVESLSAYARQFLDQMEKPKVERVTGLSPAVAIEQKPPSKNPRSTVGTVTEVYDYIRALFATVGHPYCPVCQEPVGSQTPEQIVNRILERPAEAPLLFLAPTEPRGNEGYEAVLERARADGFARVRLDGQLHSLREEIHLERRHRHRIELVVDRLRPEARRRGRLNEAVERALDLSGGLVVVHDEESGESVRYSRHLSCPTCARTFEPLAPQSFSFNHREGMCPVCDGLGQTEGLDREQVIEDPALSVRQGALAPWGELEDPAFVALLEAAGKALGFDLDTPFAQMGADSRRALLYGAPRPPARRRGLRLPLPRRLPARRRVRPRLAAPQAPPAPGDLLGLRGQPPQARQPRRPPARPHPAAGGAPAPGREPPPSSTASSSTRARPRWPASFCRRSAPACASWTRSASATSPSTAAPPPSRAARPSASAWPARSARASPGCSTCSTSPPSACTRATTAACSTPWTTSRTWATPWWSSSTTRRPSSAPTTSSTWARAPAPKAACWWPKASPTASRATARRRRAYLRGDLGIPVPSKRRPGNGQALQVLGARQNNLKNVDLEIPLGKLVCVTGVSGSGKSSLVEDIVYGALVTQLHRAARPVGEHDELLGVEHVDKVINIDQTPIGHSPRSTPATVMGVFDEIRRLYARVPEAKVRGFNAGRFSFNKPGGRCEECEGLGQKCIEMHFLPDVWVQCVGCGGRRYNQDILRIRFKGHSVSDVLDMPVNQALEVFDSVPKLHKLLQTMADVGLGYMSLGQSSTTLSGGEAQRLKLAAELARPSTGKTLYILDEPTTGLHLADVAQLLQVMHRLVDAGNTMLVVEHNMDVIKTADHLLDMGPEGGEAGGRLVACGPPEEVANNERSHTGRILAEMLALP